MSALEDLPLELIDRILAHLDDPNDVARLLVVSRTFLARAIASSGETAGPSQAVGSATCSVTVSPAGLHPRSRKRQSAAVHPSQVNSVRWNCSRSCSPRCCT